VEKGEEAVVAVERHRPRELPAGGFVEEGQRSHVRLTSTGGAAAAEAGDTRGEAEAAALAEPTTELTARRTLAPRCGARRAGPP
jgi:hypothetical protein